jgi:hypothetical protein
MCDGKLFYQNNEKRWYFFHISCIFATKCFVKVGYRKMNDEYLKNQLEYMIQEHNNLDYEIELLSKQNTSNDFHIFKLKKRKLMIKDQIRTIRSRLMTDIIA